MSTPRQRKDSDASVKVKRNLSFTGITGLRRRSTTGSGSDSGSETRIPVRASLLETQRKDGKTKKLNKDRSESGYTSGVGSDSEASDVEGSKKLKRFGTLASRMFSVKRKSSSDAVSLTKATADASTPPIAETSPSKPATKPIITSNGSASGSSKDVLQLMTPVQEETAGRSPIVTETTYPSPPVAATEAVDPRSPLSGNSFVIVRSMDTPEGRLTASEITNANTSDEDTAARTIQRNWRRAQANNAVAAAIKEKQDAAARKIQKSWRQTRSRSASPMPDEANVNDSITAAIKARQDSAARTIQTSWRRNRAGAGPSSEQADVNSSIAAAIQQRQDAAARTIQKSWRRRNNNNDSRSIASSSPDQENVNTSITAAIQQQQEAAAKTIQKSWRRRNNNPTIITTTINEKSIGNGSTRPASRPNSPLVPSKETLQVTANYAFFIACVWVIVRYV
ncbi:hypothetical protein FRB95_005533 [Tulasnella sp. JGI-2019a]|nr:hypothetical protein FRB95_005533 [Tulasnella sp. JGI-2019a]